MRVLQLHTSYRHAGGEDSVLATERRLLERAGHTVGFHVERNPEEPGAAVAALVAAPWNLQAVRRVSNTIREFEPDLAHVHNTWFQMSPAVVRAIHASGIPTVVTMHNYRLACLNAQLYRAGGPCEDCVGRVPWRGVVRKCYRDSALQSSVVAATVMTHRSIGTWRKSADLVIALSEFASERLAVSGAPAERIFVKSNVVDDPGTRARPPSASSRVLFAGRLTEEKGILDLVETWDMAASSDLELLIAGEGPLKGRIERMQGNRVHLLGQLASEDLQERLASARALIFPSRWYEGQAMILLEALAAGTPIVFADLGAIPEVVGPAGWAFQPGDPNSLAVGLAALSDDGAVDQRGEEARARFERRFSPEVGITNLENAYEMAITNHEWDRSRD